MIVAISQDTAALRARSELTLADRDEMYGLLSRHFEGVGRAQFERDLSEKDWVVEIRREGSLLGFSTLAVCETTFEHEPLLVIYSGDTIVAPEGWGAPTLARAWIAAVNRLRAGAPGRRCFWLLLTSGFRTYRFLPVFWRTFYPGHNSPTPPDRQRLLNHLACLRYNDQYDPAKGVVRFPRPQCLRGELGTVPTGRSAHPDVAFFLTRNPGHVSGDELACLTEISENNLTAAGRRMVSIPPL